MNMCELHGLLVLVCVTLVCTTHLDDHIITPCGICTCNIRQASADCTDKQLNNIPTDLSVNITSLNLARNRISPSSENQARLCQKYPALRTLSLAWNGLSTLSGLLHGCQLLEQLDLTGNVLEILDATMLTDLQKLQKLTSLEVEELQPGVLHSLKRLETLHLIFDGLTMQPGVFRELSALTSLTLVLEKALRLPKHLFSFTDGNVLKLLTLKGSKVKAIPDDLFSELISLRELHLDLPHVLELKMKTNKKPKYLKVLEVSNVRSLAEDVLSGLHMLQVVILHGISHLAGQHLFDMATAVKELEIVQCSLTQLPSGWLNHMVALETLNLNDNRLEKLSPTDFVQLTSLKHLVLSNNKIEDLPAGVFMPIKSTLRQLLVNDNQLRHLTPETFTDMPMLEVLDLRRNMINNITANSLRNLPRLQILQLSGNYISSLSHVMFHSLAMLEELDLSENMISQFPETLLASNLSHLVFSVNNLHQLPGEKMCHMTNLDSLVLDDNPVFCDCSVRLLHKCLPRLLLSGTCSAPSDVEGQNIEEITECAPSISASTVSTLFSQISRLTPFNSAVTLSLESTPAGLTASGTFSPLLPATTFTPDSDSVPPAPPSAAPPDSMPPASPSVAPNWTAKISSSPTVNLVASTDPSLALLISSSSSVEVTLSVSPSLLADTVMQTSLRSQANLLGSTANMKPFLVITLEPSLSIRSTAEVVASNMPSSTHTGYSLQVSDASASFTSSHDLMEDIDFDYDAYNGHEIVRPLVAVGILDSNDQLPVISDAEQILATWSTVASADPDLVNNSVVDRQAGSLNILDVDRAVTNDSPLQHDNKTDFLPPRIAQVKAKSDTEEINGILSVAGNITVAIFFSLVILLSILSGILLYRKYVHVGSYNAASSSRDLHAQHFMQMQPVEVDQGTKHFTTMASDGHTPHQQVPI